MDIGLNYLLTLFPGGRRWISTAGQAVLLLRETAFNWTEKKIDFLIIYVMVNNTKYITDTTIILKEHKCYSFNSNM